MLLSKHKNAVLTRVAGWVTFLASILFLNLGVVAFADEVDTINQFGVLVFILFVISLTASIFYTATTLFGSPWKKVHQLMLNSEEISKDKIF